MRIKQLGNLEIRIFPDLEQLSIEAAKIFVLASKKTDPFKVSLSGGTTPKRLYELLANNFKEDVIWQKVHIFWGDERAEKNNQESCFQLVFQNWLKIIIKDTPSFKNNIHRIKMELGLAEGAKEYSKEIEKWVPKGFDLALNGAGADGHRNGVMPENPKIKWKNEIWDLSENVKVWGYEIPPEINPYTRRITLTPWFLNKSRINILMLSGKDKAELLKKITVGREKYTERELPAITFNDVPTIVLTDEAAASQLNS